MVITAAVMKLQITTIECFESREIPQMPRPLVHPEPTRVPEPTRKPPVIIGIRPMSSNSCDDGLAINSTALYPTKPVKKKPPRAPNKIKI